jgi:hypothetical protein
MYVCVHHKNEWRANKRFHDATKIIEGAAGEKECHFVLHPAIITFSQSFSSKEQS